MVVASESLPHPTLVLHGNEQVLAVQRAILAAKHSAILFNAPEIPRRKSSFYIFKSLFDTLKKTRLAELREALPTDGYWIAFLVEAQLESHVKRGLFSWLVSNNVLPALEVEADVRRFYQFTQQINGKKPRHYLSEGAGEAAGIPLRTLYSSVIVTVD